jgi:hypothetical protein
MRNLQLFFNGHLAIRKKNIFESGTLIKTEAHRITAFIPTSNRSDRHENIDGKRDCIVSYKGKTLLRATILSF